MSLYVGNCLIMYQNNVSLVGLNKITSLPCEDLTVLGLTWLQPVVSGGYLIGYKPVISVAKPSVDSVNTIRMNNFRTGQDIYIAVADDATTALFTDKCNGCCGATPTMPDYVIPVPIVEVDACPVVEPGTSTYTYTANFPGNLNSLNFSLTDSYNGNYILPAAPEAGFANEAAVETWVEDPANNRDGLGTWSIVTLTGGQKQLKLVSTTVLSAGISIGLVAESYCIPIPASPAEINSITISGTEIPFAASVQLDRANPYAALSIIANYLEGDLTVAPDGEHYQYTGLQLPETLDLDSVTVETWVAGACA